MSSGRGAPFLNPSLEALYTHAKVVGCCWLLTMRAPAIIANAATATSTGTDVNLVLIFFSLRLVESLSSRSPGRIRPVKQTTDQDRRIDM